MRVFVELFGVQFLCDLQEQSFASATRSAWSPDASICVAAQVSCSFAAPERTRLVNGVFGVPTSEGCLVAVVERGLVYITRSIHNTYHTRR